MNDVLKELTERLVSLQKSGDSEKIEEAADALKTYLKPFEEKFFTTEILEDKITVPDEIEVVEAIAANYYKVIIFVLDRMNVNKFEQIRFNHRENHFIDVSFINNNGKKEVPLDFDAYVLHDDVQETEYLMEIEALASNNPALDWSRIIEILEIKDWCKYL